MSDNIDIPVTSSGADGIERIVSAIDRLHQAMSNLGNNSGLSRLEDQMKLMQSSITTGFAEMAAKVKTGGDAVVAAKAKTEDELATVSEKARDRQLNADRTFLQARETMSEKQLDVDVKFAQATAKVAASKAGQAALDHDKELQVEQKWLAMLETTREKELGLESTFEREVNKIKAGKSAAAAIDHDRELQVEAKWLAMLEAAREKELGLEAVFRREVDKLKAGEAAQRALDYDKEMQVETRWLAMLAAEREKELALEAAFNRAQAKVMADRAAAAQAAADRQERIAATAAERQRALNATFLTAPLGTQLRTAEKVQTYMQQPGASLTGGIDRFGTSAVTADVNALRAAHERLQQVVPGSTQAVQQHGDAMREAHSLARGLAGSLGGLWLTYGSLVPLVAGAAIAASLRNVVVVGKEVENQLNFVKALSATGEGVDLNKFLAITDSSLSSITESANAMRMLAQNGLSAGQALQVLPALLDLALVGEMDVGQAALAVTGAVSAFGLGIGEAGRVADIFARTAANSNTSVVAITESMKQASTSASLFKVSIEETAGVLGVLAKINVTGGAAGTAMTNMLTGLYEPTEKGKKALRELGLETKTSTGALKPFTEVMEEMRAKLSSFNDSAKVDILGSVFTARGVKAAMQVQENLGSYTEKVQEATTATGFMRGVVEQLENSTTGAFARLGVTVQNTYVRAFAEANPYIQQIGLSLNAAFAKGSAADTGLANFATNVARLTSAVIDNSGTIALAGVGYMAYARVAALLGPLMSAAAAADTVAAGAKVALTAATVAHEAAMVGSGSVLVTHTALTAAQTSATAASTAATAAWSAMLLPALGALGVALAAGAALWLVFRDNTTEADAGNVKISNSLHVIEEALKKEEERLERVISLWDERNARFGDDKSVSPKTVEAARTQVSDIETLIRKEGRDPVEVRRNLGSTESRYNPQSGMMEQVAVQTSRYADALAKADENLKGLTAAEFEYATKVKPQQELEQVAKLKAQAMLDMKQFYLLASERDSKGALYQTNENIRAVQLKAAPLMEELVDPKKSIVGDTQAETDRVNRLRTSLQKLKDEVNAMQGGRAAKTKGPSSSSILGGDLKELQLQVDLQRQLTQYETTAARGQFSRGEIGELQLINKELAAKADLRKVELDVARKQADMADKANKPAKEQEYTNRATLAAKQALLDDLEANDKRATAAKRMQDDITQHEISSLTDRGQLVEAFTLDFEAKYGKALRGLNSDIGFEADPAMKALMQKWRDTLGQMEEDGKNAALGKQLGGEISEMLSTLDQAFNRVSKDAEGGSLGQMFESALTAAQALDAALPGLAEKQRELQAQADISGKPEDQTRANKALKDIDNAAGRMRKVWTDVGAAIGKSLGGAFDRAGKSVGQLVAVYTTYGAKQKEIQDNLKRDVAADPEKRAKLEQKATEESSKLQIKAYGDMAGAAKGFFKEKTGAYRVLEATEKAFRAYELAVEIKNFAVKSGLLSAFTGLFVTSKAVQTGAEGTSTAASVVMAGVQATAWGITAVVKAIASMPFPYNLIAGAATLAAVVGIGAKISGSFGGGGGVSAKERQEKTGTGSILGDDKAKSESISKALERVQDNTYQGLAVSYEMLSSLRAIEAGLAGVGNILAQNGVTGTAPGSAYGTSYKVGETLAGGNGLAGMLVAGPEFAVMDKLTGGWLSKTSGQISNAVFGGKTSTQDIGLTANRTTVAQALQGGLNPASYADVKKDGGWFRSDKYYTNTQGLGTEASQQFTMIIKGMADTITQAGSMMGVSGPQFEQRLNAFVVDIGKISVKDLKPEEIQAQLAAAFSKVGDDMARWALGDLTKFQKVGEGALETLARVAQDYQAVDVVFASFGKTFGQVGLESIGARERLIELSGGLDEFLSQGSYFLENFYTEQEQADKLQARIQPTLSQYGLSAGGPDALADFRKYIEALEASGPAGAEAYAKLMPLAPALKAIADAADGVVSQRADLQDQIDELMLTSVQLRAKERSELDGANRALYDQLQAAKAVADSRDRLTQAYETEQSTLEGTADRLTGLAKSWKDFQHSLVMGDSSTLTPQQKYMEAQAKYNETLAKARGGDTAAQDAFQSVAQEFLDASRVVNSSGAMYSRDFDGVLRATKENENWANAQVDAAKASLDVLKQQAGTLVSIDEKIGSWADELNSFMRAHAEYLQKQGAASVAPGGSRVGDYLASVIYGGGRDAAEKPILDAILASIDALREQQAQESTDNIDSTYAAAQELAKAQQAAADWAVWQERNKATST